MLIILHSFTEVTNFLRLSSAFKKCPKTKQPTFQANILHCLKSNNQASEYLIYFITRALDNYSTLYTFIIMCACMFVCESVWPNYLTNYVHALVCVYVYEGDAHEKQITQ